MRPAVLILAGGRGSRMGGDKALRPFAGGTLLGCVAGRLAGQGSLLLVNGDPARLADSSLPMLPDTLPGQPGPLAGVLTGLEWLAARRPDLPDLVTVPVDGPFVPRDLVDRLLAARDAAGAEVALAASLGRTHPVVGLWPVRLAGPLRAALLDGLRRVEDWTSRHRVALAEYAADPVDPFLNVNRPEELDEAARWLASHPAA